MTSYTPTKDCVLSAECHEDGYSRFSSRGRLLLSPYSDYVQRRSFLSPHLSSQFKLALAEQMNVVGL